MRQRGRKKGGADLAVIDGKRGTRPAPPAELDEFEAAVWHRVVAACPEDWFDPSTEQLLLAYCRHSKHAAQIDQQLAKYTPKKLSRADNLKKYDQLTKMRERETAKLLSLSRSMRLTQQSINPDRAQTARRRHKEKTQASKPWET